MIINILFIVEISPYTVYHLLSTIGTRMSFKLFINVIILKCESYITTRWRWLQMFETEPMTTYHLHQQPPTCQAHPENKHNSNIISSSDSSLKCCITYSVYKPSGPSGRSSTPGGTPFNGLYGEAPPERSAFFRLQVYKRVGISQV